MNDITSWLSGGDLRSNGMSDQVAGMVIENPTSFDDLYGGLRSPDEVVRGRTADALEKVSRIRPELLAAHLPELIRIAREDEVPMVRWHLAMIFGNLVCFIDRIGEIAGILMVMLDDHSVFVRSWTISSLCLVARQDTSRCSGILKEVEPLLGDPSAAIRTRARKAVDLLIDDSRPFPPGWVKSQHLGDL